jgi:hypothetical protein
VSTDGSLALSFFQEIDAGGEDAPVKKLSKHLLKRMGAHLQIHEQVSPTAQQRISSSRLIRLVARQEGDIMAETTVGCLGVDDTCKVS